MSGDRRRAGQNDSGSGFRRAESGGLGAWPVGAGHGARAGRGRGGALPLGRRARGPGGGRGGRLHADRPDARQCLGRCRGAHRLARHPASLPRAQSPHRPRDGGRCAGRQRYRAFLPVLGRSGLGRDGPDAEGRRGHRIERQVDDDRAHPSHSSGRGAPHPDGRKHRPRRSRPRSRRGGRGGGARTQLLPDRACAR